MFCLYVFLVARYHHRPSMTRQCSNSFLWRLSSTVSTKKNDFFFNIYNFVHLSCMRAGCTFLLLYLNEFLPRFVFVS